MPSEPLGYWVWIFFFLINVCGLPINHRPTGTSIRHWQYWLLSGHWHLSCLRFVGCSFCLWPCLGNRACHGCACSLGHVFEEATDGRVPTHWTFSFILLSSHHPPSHRPHHQHHVHHTNTVLLLFNDSIDMSFPWEERASGGMWKSCIPLVFCLENHWRKAIGSCYYCCLWGFCLSVEGFCLVLLLLLLFPFSEAVSHIAQASLEISV